MTPLKLPFEYVDNPSLRILDLTEDGLPCIPVLGCTKLNAILAEGAKPHVHPECIEVLFCRRGNDLRFVRGRKTYDVRPGSVVYSLPGERHCLRDFPKNLFMYWLFFRVPGPRENILGFSSAETQWLVKELIRMPKTPFRGSPRLMLAFKRLFHLYDSMKRGSVARRLLMRMEVQNLLMALIESSGSGVVVAKNASIDAIIRDMDGHPERDYPLDELISRAGMSSTNLIMCFKRQTGMTPHSYLLSRRIERAKTLLEEERQSVGAIATSLGFSTARHFSAHFKAVVGQCPQDWRCSLKNKF